MTNKLSEEFNVTNIIDEDIIEHVTPQTNNPDSIIMNNIDNANTVLDKIITELNSGNFSARLAEVAGQLVNAVTTATEKIYMKGFNIETLQIKKSMIHLKERELELRKLIKNRDNKEPNEKIIVTDRETILKMLENKKVKKLIDCTNERSLDNDE